MSALRGRLAAPLTHRLVLLGLRHTSQRTHACLQYEPELFPGLIYRMQLPKVVLLIFVSGKVVLTGERGGCRGGWVCTRHHGQGDKRGDLGAGKATVTLCTAAELFFKTLDTLGKIVWPQVPHSVHAVVKRGGRAGMVRERIAGSEIQSRAGGLSGGAVLSGRVASSRHVSVCKEGRRAASRACGGREGPGSGAAAGQAGGHWPPLLSCCATCALVAARAVALPDRLRAQSSV